MRRLRPHEKICEVKVALGIVLQPTHSKHSFTKTTLTNLFLGHIPRDRPNSTLHLVSHLQNRSRALVVVVSRLFGLAASTDATPLPHQPVSTSTRQPGLCAFLASSSRRSRSHL